MWIFDIKLYSKKALDCGNCSLVKYLINDYDIDYNNGILSSNISGTTFNCFINIWNREYSMNNNRFLYTISRCRNIDVCRLLFKETKEEGIDPKTIKYCLTSLLKTKKETPYIYEEIYREGLYEAVEVSMKVIDCMENHDMESFLTIDLDKIILKREDNTYMRSRGSFNYLSSIIFETIHTNSD